MSTVTEMGSLFKDMYAAPGTRLKQWVVDARREDAWERETCPVFEVPEHEDNTGMPCRNEGVTRWTWLDHDCCNDCNDRGTALRDDPSVQAWIAEKAKRPPIEADRSKLSDEVQPDYPAITIHPWLKVKP